MPTIPVKLPLSMTTFLAQFKASKIIDWDLPASTRRGWSANHKNRFSKWMYLYKCLMERAARMQARGGDHETCIRRAVGVMNAEMKVLALTNTSQYLTHLKSADPRTKKRVTKGI